MMNGYQPSLHLYELDRDTLQLVIQYDPFYEVYVDMLALIHDLVCEFTDSQEKPRFTSAEIEEQKNRVVSVLYTKVIRRNPETLANNIEANYSLAQKIRVRVEHSETTDERFQAERDATQFLNSLVQIYTKLRILKQSTEPAPR